MDWGRAKSIIIIIFLILNIFLAYNLVMERWSPQVSGAQLKKAESILKERGITLKTKMPENSEISTRLAFEGVGQFDMNKIASKLLGKDVTVKDESTVLNNGDKEFSIENRYTFIYTNKSPNSAIDINNTKGLAANIKKPLRDAGLPAGNLILDRTDIKDGMADVVFIQQYGKYKLFNNYVNVKASKEGIVYIKCSLQKPSATKKDEMLRRIMPAYKVLLQNLWNNSSMVISSIDLGYNKDETDGEMTGYYEKLRWRIKTEDGTSMDFDALTGKPIKE
jgi:regulatory protein YycI of two-component signal transduction system YycFG